MIIVYTFVNIKVSIIYLKTHFGHLVTTNIIILIIYIYKKHIKSKNNSFLKKKNFNPFLAGVELSRPKFTKIIFT